MKVVDTGGDGFAGEKDLGVCASSVGESQMKPRWITSLDRGTLESGQG